MPSTTHYRRGDIVLVSFPFTDLSSSKRRPALVISPDSFNEHRQDLVLVAITSQEPDEHSITIEEQDCVDGELPKRSFVKLPKLFTIHSTLILKKICGLLLRFGQTAQQPKGSLVRLDGARNRRLLCVVSRVDRVEGRPQPSDRSVEGHTGIADRAKYLVVLVEDSVNLLADVVGTHRLIVAVTVWLVKGSQADVSWRQDESRRRHVQKSPPSNDPDHADVSVE